MANKTCRKSIYFAEMSGFWHETDVSSSDDTGDDSKDVPAKVAKHDVRMKTSSSENSVTTKTEWLSGSWPLKQFDGSLPTNKRKAEWVRYRDQFERIVSCKAQVNSTTKLTGLKIFAGDYLLRIIEMQQKSVPDSSTDVYRDTITALDKYFSQTCDAAKERMKFRDMRMKPAETFSDFVLRLENQARFCDFGREQREEEFVQALLRRAVPGIAEKLYEMAEFLGNDLERIINHGKHLDYIRAEAEEPKMSAAESRQNDTPERDSAHPTEAVNAVQMWKQNFRKGQVAHQKYSGERNDYSDYGSRKRTWNSRQQVRRSCQNCGRVHGPRECKAFRAKCYNCGKLNHFAEVCFSSRKRTANPQNRQNFGPGGDLKNEAGIINQVDDA